MSSNTCPYCGKPLRPGANFCGSCGRTILAPSTAQPEGVSPAATEIQCPSCGKPVRLGAKFCAHCGQPLPEEPGSKVDETAEALSAVPTSSQAVTTTLTAAPEKPLASAGLGARPESQIRRSRRKGGRIVLAALAAILGTTCILSLALGYVYRSDLLGRRAAAATRAVAAIPSGTLAPTGSVIATLLPLSATETHAPLTLPPSVPQATSTSTALLPIEPVTTASFAPEWTRVPTLAVTLPVSSIWLQDDFSGALNVNWKVWGDPRPIIRNGFGDSWLDLAATDQAGSAGVTTRMEIPKEAGLKIEFEAQLNPNYLQYPLFFDFDPMPFVRGPDNIASTALRLEIQKSRLILKAPAPEVPCQKNLDGAFRHVYLLKFVTDKSVELYIDGTAEPLCQIDLDQAAAPGRISFTGTGWVTQISVTGINLP